MNWKEFFRPNKKRILITLIVFFLIAFLSYKIGRTYEDPYEDWHSNILRPIGGLSPYRLNPIFWLPAPLITSNHDYLEYFPVDNVIFVSIPYWISLSYLIAYLFERHKK